VKGGTVTAASTGSPPTSKLAAKLFPTLKPNGANKPTRLLPEVQSVE
jgi:hypothetical protein